MYTMLSQHRLSGFTATLNHLQINKSPTVPMVTMRDITLWKGLHTLEVDWSIYRIKTREMEAPWHSHMADSIIS